MTYGICRLDAIFYVPVIILFMLLRRRSWKMQLTRLQNICLESLNVAKNTILLFKNC